MRLAFIGLGAMGLPMARRLTSVPEMDLIVFDLSANRLERAEEFATTATSFSEAVSGADVIFSVVPADDHVRAIGRDLVKHGESGQIYVDFSTIAPETIVEVAEQLSDVEIHTVSVALTRSTAAAEKGELVLFASGLPDDLAGMLLPALSAMSMEVRTISGLGGPKAVKLANNMVVASIDVAVDEALVIGECVDYPATKLIKDIRHGGGDSWAIVNHIEKYVLPNELGPGRFSTNYMAKDVALFSEMALRSGHAPVIAGIVSSQYRGSVAHGWGDHYHMIVKRWQELTANRGDGGGVNVDKDVSDAGLGAIASAIAGVHAVVTEDALNAVGGWGVDRKEAVGHLRGGSAGNEYLDHLDGDSAASHPLPEAVTGGLDAVSLLSARLNVPSILLEATRRLVRLGS